ncbi:MAG TPA: 30S ribosomal protein S2 [Candidatus Limnocylindrales bacterium]|jgi:small subunit ribosomal protein S2
MPTVSMRQLLEAGIHFGHQTRRWNPKMRRYIFAERNGIHIIDLAQTVKGLDAALEFVSETVARGDSVLFVGTKKQAQEPIAEEATRAEMPYVNQRWLGGMLTNFVTIRKRLGLLDQLEARHDNGEFERLSKKEAGKLTDEMVKLQRTLGGIRKMRRLPGAMFVIDPQREHIAVVEARKLEIPVIGTGDTNVDPDMLDYVIPANDDAIRAIRLLCQLVADAALEGAQERAARPADEPMAAAVEEQEEASDEMVAALAAGGTFSFEPEPDEDELLPVESGADSEEADVEESAPTPHARPATARPATARRTAPAKKDDEEESAD